MEAMIPHGARVGAAVPEELEAAVPDGVGAAVPEELEAAVPDGVEAAVPEEVEAAVPEELEAAVPDGVGAAVPDCEEAGVPEAEGEVPRRDKANTPRVPEATLLVQLSACIASAVFGTS